jgi:hypothetical protein
VCVQSESQLKYYGTKKKQFWQILNSFEMEKKGYCMDEDAKSILDALKIPEHLKQLLSLYGISSVEDLKEINSESLNHMQQLIRDDGFRGIVSFEVKATRLQYLGFDVTDFKQFLFRPLDAKKLLTIPPKIVLREQEKAQQKRRDFNRYCVIFKKFK